MVMFRDMVRTVALVPVPNKSERQFELEEIEGWKVPVNDASPIIAVLVASGTPLVQFDAVAQFVLVVPRQLVCATEASGTQKKSNKITLKSTLNMFNHIFPNIGPKLGYYKWFSLQ